MSNLYISHETAFWIWRKMGDHAFRALKPTRMRSLSNSNPTHNTLTRFKRDYPDLLIGDIDALVRSKERSHKTGVAFHTCQKPLPDRSFYMLDEGIYVASPELCLMQLARKCTTAQTVKLAMEMCGSYAIDVFDEDGFGKRMPLTNAQKLMAYAARLYSPNSNGKGVQFLKWTVDNAASPRETALCMLLCMPPRFGGYGIPLPQLNKRIELSLKEQLAVGKRYFDCDLYWQGKRVGMEYDSARFHTEMEKQEQDAVRRNMLQHKNIRMITATRLQVNQEGTFDELAHQVARALGKRMPTPKREHIAERRALRSTLFNWDIFPKPDNEEDG